MRTNIVIDDDLMADAMKALGVKTKREAVIRSLQDTVRVARQLRAIEDLRGSGWVGDLDEMRTDKPLPSFG